MKTKTIRVTVALATVVIASFSCNKPSANTIAPTPTPLQATATNPTLKVRENVNTGSAEDLVNLLVQLQKGNILAPAQTNLIIDYMQRSTVGPKRLRGDLPAGTLVAHKTGSGERDPITHLPKSTNDAGLITLPKDLGTLAIAVLVSESKLPESSQEKVIAELARAAYDAFVTTD